MSECRSCDFLSEQTRYVRFDCIILGRKDRIVSHRGPLHRKFSCTRVHTPDYQKFVETPGEETTTRKVRLYSGRLEVEWAEE